MATAMPSDLAPPEPRTRLWGVPLVAALATAAAAASVAFALAAGHPDALQVFLLEWVGVPYIVAGVIAWWCRPESRLGPLMVAGGLASAFSGWQVADSAGAYTVGAAFDIVPAALFLHLCLAFPDGRLRSRFERTLVGVAYAAAIGLQVVKLTLGGVDPANVIELSRQAAVVGRVEDVQLLDADGRLPRGFVVLARPATGAAPATVARDRGHLVRARARDGGPAVHDRGLRLAGLPRGPASDAFVVGLSPIAFLFGLLDARLARSSIGDLVVELRRSPRPPTCGTPWPARCATRHSTSPTGCPASSLRRPAGPAR